MGFNIHEAYLSIYSPQELTEEEVIANHFYSLGLDAEDLDSLIEDVGDDFFVEWVDDIMEDHELYEARRSGRIEPTTKSGKSVGALKGGARSAAINRLKKEKAARRDAENAASAAKPSGLTAALKSQSATASASKKKESPSETKGKMKGVIGKALDRARSDIKTVKDTAGVVHKTWKKGIEGFNTASDSRLARQARIADKKGKKVLGKVISDVSGAAGRAAGKAVGNFVASRRKARKEDYELVADYLVDEGYVDNYESAENMLNFMSEEWTEEILLDMDRQSDEDL